MKYVAVIELLCSLWGAPLHILLGPVPSLDEYGGRKDIRHKTSQAKVNMQIEIVQIRPCLCSAWTKLISLEVSAQKVKIHEIN